MEINATACSEVQRHRRGVTVVETTLIMVAIIVAALLVLGTLSGSLSGMFTRFNQNMNQVASGREIANDSGAIVSTTTTKTTNPTATDVAKTAASQLLKLAVVVVVVIALLALSIYLVARSEAGPQPQPEIAADEAPIRERGVGSQLLDKRGRIGKILQNEMADFDCEHLVVAKFMTPHPKLAKTTDCVEVITNLMLTKGYRHLIVVDAQEHLRGIISDRDLVRAAEKSVAEIMTPNPYAVDATTSINIAITMLVKNRISALPVTIENKVVGILTRSDLLVTMQCLLVGLHDQAAISKAQSLQTPANVQVPVSVQTPLPLPTNEAVALQSQQEQMGSYG